MLTDPSQSMAAGTLMLGSGSTMSLRSPLPAPDGTPVKASFVGDSVEGSLVGGVEGSLVGGFVADGMAVDGTTVKSSVGATVSSTSGLGRSAIGDVTGCADGVKLGSMVGIIEGPIDGVSLLKATAGRAMSSVREGSAIVVGSSVEPNAVGDTVGSSVVAAVVLGGSGEAVRVSFEKAIPASTFHASVAFWFRKRRHRPYGGAGGRPHMFRTFSSSFRQLQISLSK
jgi:hypothetical protein